MKPYRVSASKVHRPPAPRQDTAKEQAIRQVLQLISAALGPLVPQVSLRRQLHNSPSFDGFDWSLVVLAIEIDLRVMIPPSLATAFRLTARQFAEKVAALPRTENPSYTLDALKLLAHALLTADDEDVDGQARVRTRRIAPASRLVHGKTKPSRHQSRTN
jgi:hypothetical protein